MREAVYNELVREIHRRQLVPGTARGSMIEFVSEISAKFAVTYDETRAVVAGFGLLCFYLFYFIMFLLFSDSDSIFDTYNNNQEKHHI